MSQDQNHAAWEAESRLETAVDARPGRRRLGLIWPAVVFSSLTVLSLAMARKSLRADFFFDEMWRVDMIRSSNLRERYLLHDTAVAPGWLYLMQFAADLVDRRVVLRILAVLDFPSGLTLLWALLWRILNRSGHPSVTSKAVAAATVGGTLLLPGIARLLVYFNNYGFEVLVGAAVGLACFIVVDSASSRSEDRAARLLLLAFIAIGPFLIQSALFFWPFAIASLFRSAAFFPPASLPQRQPVDGTATLSATSRPPGLADDRPAVRRRRTRSDLALTTAVAVGIGVGMITWLAFYRPVAGSGGTEKFWSDVALRGGPGLGELLSNVGSELSGNALPDRGIDWLASTVGIGCAVLGWRRIRRGWRGYEVMIVLAQGWATLASIAMGWPVAPVRVNIGFTVFGLLLVPLGVFELAIFVVGRIGRTRAAVGASSGVGVPPRPERHVGQLVAIGLAGVALAPLVWPASVIRNAGSNEVFARGLTGDLLTIAEGTTTEGLVFSYHKMSHWYTHDVLINSERPKVSFRVIRDDGSSLLFEDLASTLEHTLGRASDVWCVIPYEVGPDIALRACAIDAPELAEVERLILNRIELVHFLRTNP